MKYFSLWLTTSRPLLYPLVPIVILFGYVATGGSVTTLSNSDLLILFLFTFPFSLIVYGLNDIHDYESDIRNRQRQWFIGGVAVPAVHQMILIGVLASIIGILLVLALIGDLLISLTVTAALVFAYWYSVPPIRIKARPVIDALFSGVGYVMIPFCIGTSLNGTLMVIPEVILMTLFVAGYHIFCSVRDIEADRSVGDVTTAVWFGEKASLVIVAILSLSVATTWFYLRPHDEEAQVLFLGLCFLALMTLKYPARIKHAIILFVPLILCVGFYKLLI